MSGRLNSLDERNLLELLLLNCLLSPESGYSIKMFARVQGKKMYLEQTLHEYLQCNSQKHREGCSVTLFLGFIYS